MEQMHSNCPYVVIGELIVSAPSLLHVIQPAGYINLNLKVTQRVLKSTRYERAIFVMNIVTNIT